MNNELTNNIRIISDRRHCPTPIFSRYTIWDGKRKTIRREAEKESHLFVDLYSTRLLIAVLSLLCLSCLDAFMTLSLIETGTVVEANPFMAFFLDYGIMPFTIGKFIITASALTVMVLFKNVRITRYSLPVAIKIYIAIVIYEIYLFTL
ncbi:MAG: DUF5658 family protein [Nitrospirota bacterium]